MLMWNKFEPYVVKGDKDRVGRKKRREMLLISNWYNFVPESSEAKEDR